MAKDKDILDIKLEEEIADVFDEMDKSAETKSTDDTTEIVVESEVDSETEIPLFVMVKFSANLRMYPNHTSKLLKRLKDKTKHEVLDITEGSLVALSNIWYKVEGGFVHASQVELM